MAAVLDATANMVILIFLVVGWIDGVKCNKVTSKIPPFLIMCNRMKLALIFSSKTKTTENQSS